MWQWILYQWISELRKYFNNSKSLIAYVNHALLGFYSCQSMEDIVIIYFDWYFEN